jgi:uncharacterized protein
MLKTVRGCNAACGYCYSADNTAPCLEIMDVHLAVDIVAQQMALVSGRGQVSFGWQGGEPLLAGLGFFERVVEAQVRCAPDNTTIDNDLQTNGLLLDDTFADFLSTYAFLVGLSLDGPQEVHDAMRQDRAGKGTFHRVMAAFERLSRRGVDVNALCVVGPHNVERAGEVMGFFAASGFTHVQIVPAMGFGCREPDVFPVYLVSAAQYARFLVDLFEAWTSLKEPRPSVQVFEDPVRASRGLCLTICTHARACNAGLIIDTNGDAYPCDFYQSAEYCLGNLRQSSLAEISGDPRVQAFAGRKARLPMACEACPWFELCAGGCPRNRPASGEPDVLCEAYVSLFEKMRAMGFLPR